MALSDEFEGTDRRTLADAGKEQVPRTTAKSPSTWSLIASGVLVITFAIQLFGVAIGVLPVEGRGLNRLSFGLVILVGLAASVLALVSLYRRAHIDPAAADEDS